MEDSRIALAEGVDDQISLCGLSDATVTINSLVYNVSCRRSSLLDERQKASIFELTTANMKALYEETWGWKPNEKREEMFSPKSFYFIVDCSGDICAFSHFQVSFEPNLHFKLKIIGDYNSSVLMTMTSQIIRFCTVTSSK
jgi:hypothetical protein